MFSRYLALGKTVPAGAVRDAADRSFLRASRTASGNAVAAKGRARSDDRSDVPAQRPPGVADGHGRRAELRGRRAGGAAQETQGNGPADLARPLGVDGSRGGAELRRLGEIGGLVPRVADGALVVVRVLFVPGVRGGAGQQRQRDGDRRQPAGVQPLRGAASTTHHRFRLRLANGESTQLDAATRNLLMGQRQHEERGERR